MQPSGESLPPVSASMLPLRHPAEVMATAPTAFAEPHPNFCMWTLSLSMVQDTQKPLRTERHMDGGLPSIHTWMELDHGAQLPL